MLRLPWRGRPAGSDPGVVVVARQQADRATDAELALRRRQQRRAGWLEANAHLGPAYQQVVRELAWQRRARGLALDLEQPGSLRGELGPVPVSIRGRRAWRQAAAAIQDYRRAYQITDQEQALGPVPREPAQRAAWHEARQAMTQVWGRRRATDRERQPQGLGHPARRRSTATRHKSAPRGTCPLAGRVRSGRG